jgi:hypothetical protein
LKTIEQLWAQRKTVLVSSIVSAALIFIIWLVNVAALYFALFGGEVFTLFISFALLWGAGAGAFTVTTRSEKFSELQSLSISVVVSVVAVVSYAGYWVLLVYGLMQNSVIAHANLIVNLWLLLSGFVFALWISIKTVREKRR